MINISTVFARLRAVVIQWRQHARSRRILTRLDDHALRDLGLTRSEIETQPAISYWRVAQDARSPPPVLPMCPTQSVTCMSDHSARARFLE